MHRGPEESARRDCWGCRARGSGVTGSDTPHGVAAVRGASGRSGHARARCPNALHGVTGCRVRARHEGIASRPGDGPEGGVGCSRPSRLMPPRGFTAPWTIERPACSWKTPRNRRVLTPQSDSGRSYSRQYDRRLAVSQLKRCRSGSVPEPPSHRGASAAAWSRNRSCSLLYPAVQGVLHALPSRSRSLIQPTPPRPVCRTGMVEAPPEGRVCGDGPRREHARGTLPLPAAVPWRKQ
jgi:hypothetical protein